uniref:Uncharacterized protein n=1 Tax=Talaromyces marneffei PM1 TaxID=1077442 RepID=A0A093X696_TALMA
MKPQTNKQCKHVRQLSFLAPILVPFLRRFLH